MRKWRLFFLIISSILLLQMNIGCKEGPRQSTAKYASGEIIVKFKQEALDGQGNLVASSINDLNERYGLIAMERLSTHTYRLEFPGNLDVMELVREYSKDSFTVYAEPNYLIRALRKDSDAY